MKAGGYRYIYVYKRQIKMANMKKATIQDGMIYNISVTCM